MFAGRNRSVRFQPREGTQVLVRGRVSQKGDTYVVGIESGAFPLTP